MAKAIIFNYKILFDKKSLEYKCIQIAHSFLVPDKKNHTHGRIQTDTYIITEVFVQKRGKKDRMRYLGKKNF